MAKGAKEATHPVGTAPRDQRVAPSKRHRIPGLAVVVRDRFPILASSEYASRCCSSF